MARGSRVDATNNREIRVMSSCDRRWLDALNVQKPLTRLDNELLNLLKALAASLGYRRLHEEEACQADDTIGDKGAE